MSDLLADFANEIITDVLLYLTINIFEFQKSYINDLLIFLFLAFNLRFIIYNNYII